MGMFVRKSRNRSGSVSIQIVQKVNRSNKVTKIVGVARTKREEELLILLARTDTGSAIFKNIEHTLLNHIN